MKVLMFGWEFPPFNSGGLGTACYGLTKGLTNQGVKVTFVLPKGPSEMTDSPSHVNMVLANQIYKSNLSKLNGVKLKGVDSLLVPYIASEEYEYHLQKFEELRKKDGGSYEEALYGKDLYQEVHRFAQKAELIAQFEDFDIIHAHDWMTFPAALSAKNFSKKPLVVHVHATEFDRTGGHPNQMVYDIEREGMQKADIIVAVSNYTRNMIISHYGIVPDKVQVVHNAVDEEAINPYEYSESVYKLEPDEKVVLFLGRITLQKGPDYFVSAAQKVLSKMDNVRFIVAGTGDMQSRIIEQTAEHGISHKFIFTGFLRGKDIDRIYSMADLYVMPSVSEPFGITPLEALKNNTPVLISKQSGVSEVLSHCLKVDFWDVDQMANKMIAALQYDSLSMSLIENGRRDLSTINWNSSAKKMLNVYRSVQ
ncbi:glycosyltransferase family 4 protein [Candidatus Woesearchaeota archaeon]|nr:glycosyltransferase family 4 protein [Candidatus Woesearchaeota archaeon]